MSKTKNETLNASDKFEVMLSKSAELALITGKVMTVIILIGALAVSGLSSEFNWIYFIAGIILAVFNLVSTYVIYYFLKVISNISISLKSK
jgi:membrane protein implicated in regulation of membrane protease activity